MGRVLAPYGVHGWIKARAFTASPDALLHYEAWWLEPRAGGDGWQRFALLDARCHADTVLARLEGLASPEDAALWRGASIGVPRSALPPPASGEFYWSDLVGLAVVNRAGSALGEVAGLIDTGAHPVLRVVSPEGVERLIPLVSVFVDAIEPEARRIVVDWQLDY